MLRNVILTILGLVSLLALGCSNQAMNLDKELIIYAPVEPVLADSLRQAFSLAHPEVRLQLVSQQQEYQADLVLAGEELLRQYKEEAKLQCLTHQPQGGLWGDEEGYWENFFYDPAVLLINQHFARQVGQKHLRSWSDLARLEQGRIVVENLTNSASTRNFLGSWASYQGEEEAMTSLGKLDRHISQYVQLPFSPVRMVAVGDADIAITRQSYLAKYLESSCPAYVVLPQEGTPVNLYGVALLSQCRNVATAQLFFNWLRKEACQSMAAQEQETGYLFLANLQGQAVTPKQLWQNSEYLNLEQLQKLSEQWLQSVRFGARS